MAKSFLVVETTPEMERAIDYPSLAVVGSPIVL